MSTAAPSKLRLGNKPVRRLDDRTSREVPVDLLTVVFLSCLAAILGYAVFHFGGVVSEQWSACLLALGLLVLAYWFRSTRADRAPVLDRKLYWLLVLLCSYVAFQLVPLPSFLLRVLSPARAVLLDGAAQAVPGMVLAPLSVVPSETLSHFLRIAAYVVVLLLVRELTWRISHRPWTLVLPIIFVAALEAGLGLLQQAVGEPGTIARGTYINRNHFAGLLEMALPFAVMYPVAVMRRVRFRRRSPAGPALKAGAVLVVAAVLLLGIIYSLSRMGFIAALCSLLVMGILALSPGLSAKGKFLIVGLVALSVMVSFVFLPPDQLITRFGQLSAAEEITAEGRLLLWGETLDLIAAYPLFGSGLGAFESVFLKYKISEPLVSDPYAHNDYLQFFAELGTIGFLIAAALMLTILAKAVRAALQHSDPNSRSLALACVGAIVAILVHSLVDFNLHVPANAMLLAWISGISAGLTFCARKHSVWKGLGVPEVIDVEHTGNLAKS
jgi:hypothetical protein